MKDKDVRTKQHYSHNMDPASIVSLQLSREKHPKWARKILELLAEGPLTTRMLANRLGCQSGDITKPVLDLRRKGTIVDCGRGRDPVSGRPAHYWGLNHPAEPAPTRNDATPASSSVQQDSSNEVQPQPAGKAKPHKR